MTKPNVYDYNGKLCTISEIIQSSGTDKNYHQIAWAISKGKTIAEALAPPKCYVGKINKNWTVLLFDRTEKGRRYWHVKCNNCDLKAVRETSRVNLDLMCENCSFRPRGESGLRQLYATYRNAAICRQLVFDLTLEHFRDLTSNNCFYCGIRPNKWIRPRLATGGTDWADYNYNGIDRVDNEIGYVIKNCVSCCEICNHAKKQLKPKDFLIWIKRLLSHFASNLNSIESHLEEAIK